MEDLKCFKNLKEDTVEWNKVYDKVFRYGLGSIRLTGLANISALLYSQF